MFGRQKFTSATVAAWLGLGVVTFACSSGGTQTRTQSVGTKLSAPAYADATANNSKAGAAASNVGPAGPTGPAGPAGPAGGGGTTNPVPTGGTDQQTQTSLTGKSLDECRASKQAWVPLPAPSTCGDALQTWCCVRSEVETRFATLTSFLENGDATQTPAVPGFKELIDTEGLTLYACSFSTTGLPAPHTYKATFHLAKISGATTIYKTIFLYDTFPTNDANALDPTSAQCNPAVASGP